MKARYLVPLFLFIFAFSVTKTFAQESEEPPTAKEMAELEWMIGKWDWKAEINPLDASKRFSLHVIMECGWLFDKTIIECNSYSGENFEKLDIRDYYSYDVQNNDYSYSGFWGYGGGSQPAKGSLVKHEDRWVLVGLFIEPDNKRFDQTTFTLMGDSIEVEQYRSNNGEPLWKIQEAKVARID